MSIRIGFLPAVLYLLVLSARAEIKMTPDKELYPYGDAITVNLTFKGLEKNCDYTLLAIDAYTRVWAVEKVSDASLSKTLKLQVPPMKGLSLVLQRPGKDAKEGSIMIAATCPIMLNVRDANNRRPANFYNMIWGGGTDTKEAHRLMRSIGLNGGMCYMWISGEKLAADDLDFYHEYLSGDKRGIQDTDFPTARNWFMHDVNARGLCIRSDVLGHEEWKKKTAPLFDPKHQFDELFAKYTDDVVKLHTWAQMLRDAPTPWTLKETTIHRIIFDTWRPKLAALKPGQFLFQRPFNWCDPDQITCIQASFQGNAAKDWAHQPQGFAIGDEISNTYFSNPFDFDYSEVTFKQFREWLKKEYPSLDALNAEWGTHYAQWDAVIPYTIDETRILNMPEYKKRMLKMLQDGGRFEIPWESRTVPDQRNYASWSDFRTFQDTAWADRLSELSRAIRKIDSTTPIGIEGAQAPAAFGGFDYDKLIHSEMNWIEPYDISCSKEILRSFNKTLPEEKRWCISRTHFPYGESGKYSFWWYLFMRDSHNIMWQMYAPDGYFTDPQSLQMTEKAVTMRKTMLESIDGIGKAFAESQEPFYPIAIYLSQRSVQAHWMIDSEFDGSTWINRFASTEAKNNSLNLDNMSWTKLLDDLGYTYDFVGQTGLLAGDLEKHGYRVLILPKTIALNDEEAAAISKFVTDGGTVVADTSTGILDGHCKARPKFKGALDDLFGIQRTSYALTEGYNDDDVPSDPCFIFEGVNRNLLTFNDPSCALAKGYVPQKNFYAPEAGLQEAGAKALAAQGSQPALFMREHGAGRTLYLGASLLRYCEDRLIPGQTVAIRAVIANMLRDLVKLDPCGSGSVGGQHMDTLKIRPYTFGENAWLYGICQNVSLHQDELGNVTMKGLANATPIDIDLDLANSGYLYDARQGKYLGNGHTARVHMIPTEGVAVSMLPYKVDGVDLKAEPVEGSGGLVRVNLTAQIKGVSGKAARHVLRFQTFDPQGRRVRYDTVLTTCDVTGAAHATVYLSPNDETGRWTFSVVDSHTGFSSPSVGVEKKTATWRDLHTQDDPYVKTPVITTLPENEMPLKPGLFMAMHTPKITVADGSLHVLVPMTLLPELDETPDGTLTVFDQTDSSLPRQTFNVHELLKNATNGLVNVLIVRPLNTARDMDVHAVLEYTGGKREESQAVKLGLAPYGTPRFDAALSDPLWEKASVMGNFVTFDAGKSARNPVQIKMAYDKQYVYVAMDVTLAGGSKNLVDADVGRCGDWYAAHLDTIEMRFGKTHASEPKYNLALSWNGNQSDKVFGNDPSMAGIHWDGVTRKNDHGWTGMARIPLSALRCGAPGAGDIWLMDFTHSAFSTNEEITEYAPQGRGDFNIKSFGRVIMSGNPDPSVGKLELPRELPTISVPMNAKPDRDGKLGDAFWKQMPPLQFHYLEGLLLDPEDATVARLAADQNNLYFKFEASERFMQKLVLKTKANNDPGIWNDDIVELLIDPDGSANPNAYLHVMINAAGMTCARVAKDDPASWQPALNVRVAQNDNGWTAEGRIPFSSFHYTPKPGSTLHLNLVRTKPGKGKSFWEETSWSPIFDADSKVPSRFGIVTFQ